MTKWISTPARATRQRRLLSPTRSVSSWHSISERPDYVENRIKNQDGTLSSRLFERRYEINNVLQVSKI